MRGAGQSRHRDLKILRGLPCRKWFLLQMAEHLFVAEIIVAESVAGQQ